MVFARQLQALSSKGDVAVGISTSGNSANVLNAAQVGRERGLLTIGMTGRTGGKLKGAVDYCICISVRTDPENPKNRIFLPDIFFVGLSRKNFTMNAIFLDRDGVINRKAADGEYITNWLEMEILP